ncbi:hypothetical protein ILUMI_13728 [Ignelater luminosus]|uniref:Sodium-coupled monocarboxylate transporter 1 n=1 Tax=Ignelater luminosus TaxID=2038154 RepID=A0A8K0CX89_IGNLU|nr:hypothetical protein ILUMI_13728 [Ignelater luminosus]
MNFISLSWADYTLFVLMFGLSLAIGIYHGCFSKQQKTATDYLLGGKKMKSFPVAMSLVASTLSGLSLLSFPAEIYLHGTLFMLLVISIILMGFAVNFIYLPVFWKLQVTTIFEYLEIRFHKSIRTIASSLFTVNNFIYLPVVIYVPSLAFNQVTGFNLHIIAVVMSLLCIFYTTIGGLKAVVWTDALQLSVTLCTLGCVFIMGTISVGGLASIWERAEQGERIEFFNFNPDPTIRNTFWTVLIGTLFSWTSFVGTNPATAQRFLAVSSLSEARKVLVIFIALAVITKIICGFSGLIIYAKYYDCDPLSIGGIRKADQILAYYVLDVANQIPGLSGLFVAGLFSTALSTLSTFLNSLSGIIYNDFIKSLLPVNIAENRASTFMKIITVVIGLVSVGMIFIIDKLGTLIELLSTLSGATLGPILGVFTMGMLFPFANKKGALTGMLISLSFMTMVVIKYQIHVWNGDIKYPTKPLHTYGCNETLFHGNQTITLKNEKSSAEVFWLYRISVHYYVLIGATLSLITGLPVSWFTATKETLLLDPDTISPFVQRFLSKSVLSFKEEPLQKELDTLVTKNINKDDKEGMRYPNTN